MQFYKSYYLLVLLFGYKLSYKKAAINMISKQLDMHDWQLQINLSLSLAHPMEKESKYEEKMTENSNLRAGGCFNRNFVSNLFTKESNKKIQRIVTFQIEWLNTQFLARNRHLCILLNDVNGPSAQNFFLTTK